MGVGTFHTLKQLLLVRSVEFSIFLYILYKFIIILSEYTYKKCISINFLSVKYKNINHFKDRSHSREKGGVGQNLKRGDLDRKGGVL